VAASPVSYYHTHRPEIGSRPAALFLQGGTIRPDRTTDGRAGAALPEGERGALDALFPLVYDELRAFARNRRNRNAADTLDTTGLVHEAYLKLARQKQIAVTDRAHFLALAATAMRHIVSNHARERMRIKRGGDLRRLPPAALDRVADSQDGMNDLFEELPALDVALTALAARSPRLVAVVECRFYAGLSIEDTALALDTSPATVKRDWALARAWLMREILDRGGAT
jgi:RNA polymerase sigma-70 factor, ECF subfamily